VDHSQVCRPRRHFANDKVRKGVPKGTERPLVYDAPFWYEAHEKVFFFSEENKGEIGFKIVDSQTNEVKFETSYITYDCEEEALEFPENINFNSCISMSSARFHSDLKQLEAVECEYVKLCQCKAPNGANRLRLVGIGSSHHKNPSINIDEQAPAPNTKNVNVPGTSDAAAPRDLPELEMTFPLKKLVTFAKAHCLDSNVGIHLGKKGALRAPLNPLFICFLTCILYFLVELFGPQGVSM
jgi:hypothetical protein